MDSKQFKKILKESLSTGASSLFEQEDVSPNDETEEIERPQDEKEESSELMDYAEAALPSLEKTQQEINSLESEMKISPENFARAFAYYYVSIYHNDDSKWKYTIATPARYRTLMSTLLDGTKTNIVCEYVNIVKLAKKEKMFENPMNFLKDLQSLAPDKEVFMAISSVLESVHDGKYDLDSSNSKKLQNLISKVEGFDPNKCKSMEAPSKAGAAEAEQQTIRTKEQQPMSLESLKSMIKKTDARDYATKIINALKSDMKDLRVKVNEAREKTPLLKNTIKVLQSIPDKDVQKTALKSILDFFRVNNLQISGKTQSKLTKAGILSRQNDRKSQSGESEGDKEENEEDSSLTQTLDMVQSGLDVAGALGLFPALAPLGMGAGVLSLFLNLTRGKFGWALFDLITLVPVVGGAAKAGKLGKAAKTTAAAAKLKTGQAMVKVLGNAKRVKSAKDVANVARIAKQIDLGIDGAVNLISETIPLSVWSKIENAKIPEEVAGLLPEEDRDKSLIDAILDYMDRLDIPVIDGKIELLKKGWNEIKREMESKRDNFERADTEEIPRPSNNLNEQRYDMLIERFNIK